MNNRKDSAYYYYDESDNKIKYLRYNKRCCYSPQNIDEVIDNLLNKDYSYRRKDSPNAGYLEQYGILLDNLLTKKDRTKYEITAREFYKLGFKNGTENMHFPYSEGVPENTYKLLVRLLHILGIQFHYELNKGLTMTQCEDPMIPECFISKWLNEINDRLDSELKML
jgi:hypothetical protein